MPEISENQSFGQSTIIKNVLKFGKNSSLYAVRYFSYQFEWFYIEKSHHLRNKNNFGTKSTKGTKNSAKALKLVLLVLSA